MMIFIVCVDLGPFMNVGVWRSSVGIIPCKRGAFWRDEGRYGGL